MNPKIFVGVAVVALAAIIGLVSFSGQSLISDVSEGFLSPSGSFEIQQLQIELESIEIQEVTARAAFLDVKFKVTNPNPKSVILKQIQYALYENDEKIHISTIGERPEGGIVMSSNYITVLSESSITVPDKIEIRNTGNTPEFWDALMGNAQLSWKITGEAFSNLSSMTSGGENEILFELTP
jgi:LEA14-like dessication related protein